MKMNKKEAMDKLYEHKNILTYQQYRTFRGQICAGDIRISQRLGQDTKRKGEVNVRDKDRNNQHYF